MKIPIPFRMACYRLEHAAGHSVQLPINLTVSVTYRCGSRCGTCGIWQRKSDELSLAELEKTYRSLRKVPVWATLSGGDQFLRPDLGEIVDLTRRELEPSAINIPMNGLALARIRELLPKVVQASRGSQLILNLSVDEIGDEHDKLRGAKGNWRKLLEVADLIRSLQPDNPHVLMGVHTVVSRANVARIPDIQASIREIFRPDSYVTEVAEQRVELLTTERQITPDPADYRRAAAVLKSAIGHSRAKRPVARLIQALRMEYYDLAAATLEQKRQIIPCYAGLASAQLAPDGEVWGCCVRAESLGNVRDYDYDFAAVWAGAKADAFRASVRAGQCSCPLANAAYTNMILDPATVARAMLRVAGL